MLKLVNFTNFSYFALAIDRQSALGNPFVIQNGNRDAICDAYDKYARAVLYVGLLPVAVAEELAEKHGLSISSNWKRPTYNEFAKAFSALCKLAKLSTEEPIGCWCKPARCHGDSLLQLVEELNK